MSVILTACRQSRQKAIERALKKKAEEKRKKREARMNDIMEATFGAIPTPSSAVKNWTFLLNDEPISVVIYKDTLNVYCNGCEVETINAFCDDGATIDFALNNMPARIRSIAAANQKDGIIFLLTIDGNIVPE